MKRMFVLSILILAVFLQGCQGSAPLLNSKQELVRPTALPTNTPVPKNPTEKSYYDDFSAAADGWSDLVTVTTQAMPGKMKSSAGVKDGLLTFSFMENETYLYKFYSNPAAADVVIESKAQGAGQLENGIALVCRAKNDYSAWYEARVSSLNQYHIYRYDASRKNAERNPYILVQSGSLRPELFRPTKENVIRFTCQGSELTLEVNDQLIGSAGDDTLTEGGLSGVGAMSGSILPVTVRFDYFSYGQP